MIHVQNLTKFYGDYPAVRDVTFSIPRGQVVGFLGPNGAGKTTTMRILAGFLSATSGSATIDGHDVFWDSIAVRRRVGYMPENCPLYGDMRVREYLSFRAGIKGLNRAQKRTRLDYVIKQCWLGDVERQLIGARIEVRIPAPGFATDDAPATLVGVCGQAIRRLAIVGLAHITREPVVVVPEVGKGCPLDDSAHAPARVLMKGIPSTPGSSQAHRQIC
jgi:ABC-type glutathione transport system ATPase component